MNRKEVTRKGSLFVVTAPSGAGKTSLIKALLEATPGLKLSTSYTTRAPRPGEQNGREYHFVDEATFLAELRDAMQGGARGYIVGRTVWEAALVEDEDELRRSVSERAAFLARAVRVAEAG